jgi:hypothetical protein
MAHQRVFVPFRHQFCDERTWMGKDEHMLMRLLTERVPVTLLLDLLTPPDAHELYRREGGAEGPFGSPVAVSR